MLAERPKLADIKNHPRHFVRQFDEWFKDSTGFREQLLVLHNVVSKNKWLNNNVQYSDGQYVYIIGEKGHHFFAHIDGFLISKFQGKQFLSDEQLAGMAEKLEMVKNYLDSKGIPMIVMFCVDKESIYPEFYPKSIKRGKEPIQLDIITNYLKEHTSIDVFNIKQVLLAEKDNYLLYPVSSGDLSHPYEIYSFIAYSELMKHINIYFPEITPYNINDIEINYDENTPSPYLYLKAERTYKEINASFFNDVELNRPFTWENMVFENTRHDLPEILFFRDSFSVGVGKYIAQQFGKTIFIHWGNLEHFKNIIEKYKPDLVVFESAEYQIKYFNNYVNCIPKLP